MTTNDEDNYNTFVIKWKDSLKSFLNDPVDTRSFCISQHGAREPGAWTTCGPRYIAAVRDIVTNSPTLVTNAHKKTTPTN